MFAHDRIAIVSGRYEFILAGIKDHRQTET